MKKILALTMGIILLCTLCACGESEPPAPAAGGYQFETEQGTVITLGDKMEELLPKLGEPQDYFEDPSCAFEGVDKRYYYSGFIVYTFPWDGADYVMSVTFRDDMPSTKEGAYLGMSFDEIKAMYGAAASEQTGELKYEKGGTSLTFRFESGLCNDIKYYFDAALPS